MTDPVPFRSGIWRGDRDVVTPPPIDKATAAPRADAARPFSGSAGSGYEYHRERIGDHEGGAGFLRPTKAAIGAWFQRHGALVDTAWLRADLERAIREAPRNPAKHDDQYIEFRVHDLDTLLDAIRALEASKAAAPSPTCEPFYPPPLTSVDEARAVLAAAMDRFTVAALAWTAARTRLAA